MDKSRIDADWEKVFLLGVKIDALSLDRLLLEMKSYVLSGKKVIVSNVNVHAMNIAYSTPWFRIFLNQSHLTFCDGVGVKLAARLTGQRLNDRFTPPDFIHRICEGAIRFDWKIFFLGAKHGVAERAADKLVSKYPGLRIKAHHGFFEKAVNSQENKSVVEQINSFRPQILIVGFGMPLQEKWILDNIDRLDFQVVFPAGAVFDYLSGALPRAPRWITDRGLEWLSRLIIEPGRLWKRYILGNPLFFLRIFAHHFIGIPLPHRERSY